MVGAKLSLLAYLAYYTYSTLEAINFAIVRGCIALDTCFYGSQDFFLVLTVFRAETFKAFAIYDC